MSSNPSLQNTSDTMLRIMAAKEFLDRKVQAPEITEKDVEESVRALEDFEIELDQSFEDWVEIIDHAAPKTRRAIGMKASEAATQGYVIITKNAELDAVIVKKEKKTASVSDDAVLVMGSKLTRPSGDVKK